MMKASHSRCINNHSGAKTNAQNWKPARTNTKCSGALIVSPCRGGGACTVKVGIVFLLYQRHPSGVAQDDGHKPVTRRVNPLLRVLRPWRADRSLSPRAAPAPDP